MISLSVDGLINVDKAKLAEVDLDDLVEDILDASQGFLLNRIRTRFLNEQDPEGKPWPGNKSATRRRSGKNTYRGGKRYTGTGINFETGAMFHSIVANKDNKRGYRTIQTLTDLVPYAPERHKIAPWMGFNEDDVTSVTRLGATLVEEFLNNLSD